jgi:hypothetical protein
VGGLALDADATINEGLMRFPPIYFGIVGWCFLLFPMLAAADGNAPADDAGPACRVVAKLHVYTIGDIDPHAWTHFTDEQQSAAVAGLKQFAEKNIAAANVSMPLFETPHFLIYSDAGSRRAREYGISLEDAYKLLVSYFKPDLSPASASGRSKGQGTTIWRGKALIFLFRDNNGLQTLMPAIHPGEDQSYSITLNGNGSVDFGGVASDEEMDRRWMLLAMTEGFLYRFRSPAMMDPWVNDGLSATFCDGTPVNGHIRPTGVLRDADGTLSADGRAADWVKSHDLSEIFDATDALGGKLVVFDSVTTFMVRSNPRRYAQFIVSLKDGMKTDQALKEKYGADADALKQRYLDYLSRLK